MATKKPTPLGLAVLSLLMERPMHPYEMMQLFIARHEDEIVKVKAGTLYHTVERLANRELITAVGTERAGNRPERTSYRITPAGRHLLRTEVTELLATPFNEYPRFPQALAEAHNLPLDVVIDQLGTRIEHFRAKLTLLRIGTEHLEARPLAKRLWLDVDYLRTMYSAELDWLTTLVEQLSDGNIEWTGSARPAPHETRTDPDDTDA